MTEQNFIDNYKPLAIDFVKNISSVNYDKISEPFLPIYGQLYESAPTRIVFVGMETRGYGNIKNFVKNVEDNPGEAIFRGFEEFDDLAFCDWGTNFGNSFWDFNFKFLANFHGIDNWKKVKQGETEEILRSFAWGNMNSIESYGVTAQKEGVLYEDWLAVKQGSKCFDWGKYLINALQPHIIVILNWEAPEAWLTDGIDNVTKQEIDDHFYYYYLPTQKTHILWTAHPTWLAKNKDFDQYIKYLVDFVKQRP